MIVPQFWAESRIQHNEHGRKITVRRFGWSDTSPEDAQSNADARAKDALASMLAGEKLVRREPKMAYNGADGVPIREEVLSRHADTIITRNAYGARCLNTPNVMFADIDFAEGPSLGFSLLVLAALMLIAWSIGWFIDSLVAGIALGVVALLLISAISKCTHRLVLRISGGAELVSRKRIGRYLESHPQWNLRLYRTPAGMRVIVTHQLFSPREEQVTAFFEAISVDTLYAKMCRNQQCFRARVSAKPWRIGIQSHLRPRPGVWPVAAERLPARNAWVNDYEARAKAYAACIFMDSMGCGVIHPQVESVVQLHDELCSATGRLPIA